MPPVRPSKIDRGFDEKRLRRELPGWLISFVLHSIALSTLMLGAHAVGVPDGSRNGRGTIQIIGTMDKTTLGSDGGSGDGGNDAVSGGEATETEVRVPIVRTSNAPTELISKTETQPGPSSLPRQLLSLPGASSASSTSRLPLRTPQVASISRSNLPTRLPGSIRPRLRSSTGTGNGNGNGSGAGQGTGKGIGGSAEGVGQIDGTSFFQIAAEGTYFCYVVDCSSSMDGAAMGLARAEMMASLERLDSNKKFQILFYNSKVYPLTNGRMDVFYATESNRLFARQFINNQQPDASTAHMPALVAGLATAPDVIFFLTDGDIPDLKANELRELVRLNRNNTQIHVVEFGDGVKLGPPTWLEKLAKDHRGSYRYRDIHESPKD